QKDGKHTFPIVGLKLGDHLTAVVNIPSSLRLDSLDEETVEVLQKKGCEEFLISTASLPAQPTAAAVIGGGDAKTHARKVAETNTFLEKVGRASEGRSKAAAGVEEMFNQGRSGKPSTRPAMEAVEEILKNDTSTAMVAVAGLKASDQTYAHCVDMSAIFHDTCVGILAGGGTSLPEKLSRSTLAAGFMHDIGKSQVPKEILESTKRYAVDSREMLLMRKHVDFGAKILSDAGMDKTMINVAHYHHVKKDTSLPSSYPDVDYKQVMPMTRLAAVVDVYQALIGKRSYKKNWVPGKAVEFLSSLKGTEFDDAMLDHFLIAIGKYPVGSLVCLSTGDLAFVTSIEGLDLARPVVAVVENSAGQMLRSHLLIDLMVETDLSITEVVDHYEHYSEDEDHAFRVFSSLNVV
ncbi:MAG: HD domain-containing phosphohydrolase, partial [bacterium]